MESRRAISQIVVSLLLLSVAVAVTASSGSTIMRMVSSYRPNSNILIRVGEPSLDIDMVTTSFFIFRASVSLLNMGSVPIQVTDGSVYLLIRGTTGRSKVHVCWFTNVPFVISPGSTITVQARCTIPPSEIVSLFSSSWTGDLIKGNVFYVFMRVVIVPPPGEEYFREVPGIVF